MGITENNWHEEQERVNAITGQMRDRVERLGQEVGRVKTEVVDIRKNFWDEVTVNVGSTDDVVETYISIKQQAEVLSERERRYSHSAAALKTLTRLVQTPYFGRIDFTEDGVQETEPIYVGIASFVNQEDDTFLVYDWRAPVSSLYYDYAPGPVAYHAPCGEVAGTMSLKRQYVIRNGHIHLMFDTGVTIGDELLMQVLSRHSDAQMKSIVATIQKEQNRVIRNDRGRMLVVHGPAGSGKTSAAMQRVAYLLYKYRNTLQADQMVLFSPNPLFNSYVSTVLPDLGEENMQQTTFQEYLEHRLRGDFQLEDPFTQLEYVLTCMDTLGYSARMSGIRYKSSVAFLEAIRSYTVALEREGVIFTPVKFGERVIVTPNRIKEQFYSFDPSIRITNRLEMLRDWLLKELSNFEAMELQAEWVEEAINLLEPEDYHRAHQQLRRIQKGRDYTFDDFEVEKGILSKMVIQERSKPVRTFIKRLKFIDVLALYKQLFTDKRLFTKIGGDAAGVPEFWNVICEQTVEKLERSELAYEDATPFLYLKELMQGLHANTSIRHVIVDEAQDYSALQLEFLKRLFPRCRMTTLGDLNQAIYAHGSALGEFDALSTLYGPEQTEVIHLARSYRSTREIVEFTRGMVPGGEDIVPFNRSGGKPRITIVNNLDDLNHRILADITSLNADGFESIAVICKTADETADAYASLQTRLELRLVTKFSPTFEKETLIIPAYLAKGVEFDAVIIYNGSEHQYRHEHERKLFYTACTRAMHRLHIYSFGEPSPFISDQHPDRYLLETTN